MPRNWTPPPVLHASLALHGVAAVGAVAEPALWPWGLGMVAANHAALALAGLLPRTTCLGPNLTGLPAAAVWRQEVALTIDDGPDPEATPRVLDQLDAAGVQATFFCIGRRARQHPALCRDIVRRGHRVENHGHAHAWTLSLYGPRRLQADIATAQATLSDITGQAPRFFRPTAGLRNVFLEPVLAALDLHLAAWTRRGYDTREGRAATVLARLTRGLGAGDILLLHDGHAARTAAGQPVILEVLPDLLQACAAQRLRPVTLSAALT